MRDTILCMSMRMNIAMLANWKRKEPLDDWINVITVCYVSRRKFIVCRAIHFVHHVFIKGFIVIVLRFADVEGHYVLFYYYWRQHLFENLPQQNVSTHHFIGVKL